MNVKLNCKRVSAIVQRESMQDLSPQLRMRVEEHLSSCERCLRLARLMKDVDRVLALHPVEAPLPRSTGQVGFLASRLRMAGNLGVFATATILGGAYGARLGAAKLFGEAYAADLPGAVRGLRNQAFDDGALTGGDDWTAHFPSAKMALPTDTLQGNKAGVPNFYEIDREVTRSGSGSSLKLFLRSFGGSVSRRLEGPFPAGTLVKLRAWVLMEKPASTRNKWLSFGIGGQPADDKADRPWSTSIDVFDASPSWRPYTLSASVPAKARWLDIGFSTSAGDGGYQGWDRAAWIDDVQVSIEVPMTARTSWNGNSLVVRFADLEGFTVSEDPEHLKLWTYGGKLPLLRPKSVGREGSVLICTYEHPRMSGLIAEGNQDTGALGLPIKIEARLRRGKLSVVGTCGAYAYP